MSTFYVLFDGGAHPNPGRGYGSWLLERDDRPGKRYGGWQGERNETYTNNQAEYVTLIEALSDLTSRIKHPGRHRVVLTGDSQLVLKQLSGEYQANNDALAELRRQAMEMIEPFDDWGTRWVRRQITMKAFGH